MMSDKLREAAQAALEALEAMKAEFRALDLPYGSKAYAQGNAASNDLRAALAEEDTTTYNLLVKPAGDWDRVEALEGSLREHMAEIHRLRARLVEYERRIEGV